MTDDKEGGTGPFMAQSKRKSRGKTASPGAGARLPADADELLAYYREMLLIRRFEEKAGQLYGMGLIGGFCHLYIGQEAVCTGIQHAIRADDSVITGYRCHGFMLARGAAPNAVMAELAGRSSGVSKGKGGSMHMFDAGRGFFGGHGIVAAQVPIGVGLALSHKYQANGRICVTCFGEGAANQGQVYESFNMASLWGLPAVFVIENNQYAMGTSIARAKAGAEMYERGIAFGIPGRQVDGMDVLAVEQATAEAALHCREDKGPILLEMMTYRYRGHSMSDPAKYRTKEEVSKVRHEHDAIDMVRQRLIDDGHADEAGLKEIDREIKATVNEAAEVAQAEPEPAVAELTADIYAAAGADEVAP